MRNPNRQPGPIKRTIVQPARQTIGTNPGMRSVAYPMTGPTRKRKRTAVNPSQPEWRVSPFYSTHATVDIRWSATCSE